ncbi:GNAT family N-acetyltransferase [Parasphingopyxis lamellibrachiae]|uniref:Ribosomal protein S18 acetylase RimI-like enzyme n=1 Tax=Parasphingopyxis lamellibrachiae TaxID=680125 RepID=A0A3D9FC21_9SPHN|nr:GNAT family N-acetyltransferase [Parasphingopyxis lamellibrachiae]RED15238.1 ribosomal protein S18 acetylase RimI-like enzyme [Parasphingopyxis lamellibrachiae]
MGLETLKAGELGAIVTYLDMRERPRLAPPPPSPLRLKRWEIVDPGKYRTLFTRVGGPWLWFSRLAIDERELLSIIRDPQIEIFAVEDRHGIEVGMLELDFRESGDCELSYLGLVPELAGAGHGKWLMAEALNRAWRKDISRVHVHTCTLDHPGALRFYRNSGFTARGQSVETFPDPRLLNLLPRDFAPHVPLREA